jgi:hypothetical protein
MKEKTVVIFRVWRKEGTVIALFPDIDGDGHCSSYEHVGQHSPADYKLVVSKTRLATPEEYADLLKELDQVGYNLDVRQRRIGL